MTNVPVPEIIALQRELNQAIAALRRKFGPKRALIRDIEAVIKATLGDECTKEHAHHIRRALQDQLGLICQRSGMFYIRSEGAVAYEGARLVFKA